MDKGAHKTAETVHAFPVSHTTDIFVGVCSQGGGPLVCTLLCGSPGASGCMWSGRVKGDIPGLGTDPS